MSELNFYLLQINDALFPIGAYSHSQGLETYIQRGIVHDEATAKEYIHHKIRWNLAFTELLAARLSYLAAAYGDLEQLLSIEEILEASDGTKGGRTENGVPFCKDDRKAGAARDKRGKRDLPSLSYCQERAGDKPLLYLRCFLRCHEHSACRCAVVLSLCADFRDRDKLRQNDPVKPERRTAASRRMLCGICRDFKRSGTPECGGSLSFCAGL